MRGKGGGGHEGGEIFLQVYAQNYSGAQFIAPRQGLIPGTIPVTGPVGDWEEELHKSCGITTL